MAEAVLKIAIGNTTLEAEGSEAFVKAVFEEFRQSALGRERVSLPAAAVVGEPGNNDAATPKTPKARRRLRTQSGKGSEEGGEAVAITSYKPTLDKSLDTSDLKAFMDGFSSKNTAEAILLIVSYLEQKRGISPCSVDQVFTCFHDLKIKIPVAFGQAFVTTRGDRYGYIDFTGIADITLTIRGTNLLNSGDLAVKAV